MLKKYQQIIEQCRQQIFSFACYSLRSREDAEDVLQEVSIRLWQHWHNIDQEKVAAWLMSTTRNAVIDRIRSQRARREDAMDDSAAAELPAETPSREGFDSAVELAISELPEQLRTVLILRDVQGMSYLEVGHILQLSQSQVKVYLHRARRRLRETASLRALALEAGILREARRPSPIEVTYIAEEQECQHGH